jgi:putative addiction module component (TIGR02574 family)
MSEIAERLKNELTKLPQSERAEQAHFLLQSLDEERVADEDAFDAELMRRWAEIENGTAKRIPAEVVFEKMRRRYP